jgi:hypothetical protein
MPAGQFWGLVEKLDLFWGLVEKLDLFWGLVEKLDLRLLRDHTGGCSRPDFLKFKTVK